VKPIEQIKLGFSRPNAKGSAAHDLLGVWATVWIVLPMALGFLAFSLVPGVPTFILCFVLVANGYHGLTILAHETYHWTLFRSRRVNDLVGAWLYSYPVLGQFSMLRRQHFLHHRFAGTEKDPDLELWDWPRDQRRRYALHLLYTLSGAPVARSFLSRGKERETQLRGPAPTEASGWDAETLKVVGVQLGLLGIFTLTLGWQYYFALWLLPIVTLGRVIAHLRAFLEHQGGTIGIFEKTNTFERLVFGRLNFHLHGVHHAFPSEPWFGVPSRIVQGRQRIPEMVIRRSYMRDCVTYFFSRT
jgi:fatty acid desaturase